MKHKILMTLALLLMAVTGAWAADTYTITFSANGKNKTYTDVVLPAEYKCEYGSPGEFDNIIQELYEQDGGHGIENATPTVTGTDAITPGLDGPNNYAMITITAPFTGKATVSGTYAGWSNKSGNSDINYSIEVYFGTPSSDDDIDFKWDAATKTGTFTMPAFDVEIAPIYAPTAQWAKVENVDQIPAAIEGIFAGTTDAIVTAGTVVEGQGQAMFFATTDAEMTAEKAAKADGWLATVPTAEGYDGAQTVYVWYYIKGADTPEGQEATAENTFNDSEICATPITVNVLSNKFDINFKAANDNTIEAGKATVTVSGAAATVTEGKLEGVKMGSEVKMTAKEGYKFRKAEGKKNDGSTSLDESTVGMIVCTNGKAYPVNMKDNLPSGVTAVGIVAYKNGKNGLVMALTDEATNMNWGTATGDNGAKAHTPAVEGYSWKVPTINEWQYNIFTGAGVGNLAGLSTYMTAAGGTGLQNGCYWTSTPKPNNYYARCIEIENGSINFNPSGNTTLKSNGYHVRAVFAF